MDAFLIICDILIPAIMVGFGLILWKHPPKKINGIYGYRTGRSMKSIEAWNFAQRKCGKLWFYAGIALMIFSAVILFFCLRFGLASAIQLSVWFPMLQCVVLILSIIPVELSLKFDFDERGKPAGDNKNSKF